MKRFAIAICLLGLAAWPAQASLLGEAVNGSISFGGGTNNFFDPGRGFVPAGFGNSSGQPVTIDETEVEFGFDDGNNLITADFSETQLIITTVSRLGFGSQAYSFTSVTPGLFATLSLVTTTFPDLDFELTGGTISVTHPTNFQSGTYTAVFDLTTEVAVPEPAAAGLLALGLLGLAAARRRR